MEKTIFSQLETTALFAGLTANAIERQLEKLPYSIRKVPAKTVFLSANEPLREMVMVLEGRVSAKMTTPQLSCFLTTTACLSKWKPWKKAYFSACRKAIFPC